MDIIRCLTNDFICQIVPEFYLIDFLLEQSQAVMKIYKNPFWDPLDLDMLTILNLNLLNVCDCFCFFGGWHSIEIATLTQLLLAMVVRSDDRGSVSNIYD